MTKQTPPVEPIVPVIPTEPSAAPIAPPAVPATPPAQAPPEPPAPPQQDEPEGYVAKERYTGAIQKIETLALSQKDLQQQVADKSSSLEQLNSQLAEAEALRNTSLGEKDTTITELQGQITDLTASNAALKSLEVKIETLKEVGRPDLLPILEHLPDTADPAKLKEALEAMAGTVDAAVKARSEQLLSGVVETPSVPGAATVPQSADGWVKHIESLPLGSKERETAMDDYGTWLHNQGAL